ncbi:hypothetical protein AZOA_25560 [Azoarcus sp. Aa7]|nr:hypothetical protein [Azoarcus sp. Aa7]
MSEDDKLQTAKSAVELVGALTRIAGDNPDVREAGRELGRAALTVAKCVNNALLPIAAVNYGFQRARDYFSERFGREMMEMASPIPANCVVEPKPSIAGPALQGLAFSHEEPDLKKMYLSLLASAMDGRRAEAVHPAFVEVIRQLTAKEAGLLKFVLSSGNHWPIGEVRLSSKQGRGWVVLKRHVLHISDTDTQAPVEEPHLPAMVDNWIRLGLVTVSYDEFVSTPGVYDPFHQRPEVVRFKEQQQSETHDVGVQPGILTRTAFGHQFAQAVGLIDQTATSSA